MKHIHQAYPLTLLYDGDCPICRIESEVCETKQERSPS